MLECKVVKTSVRIPLGRLKRGLGMWTVPKLRTLVEIVRTIQNWPSALVLYAGLKKEVTVVFRNGIQLQVKDKSMWQLIILLIKISLHSRILHETINMHKVRLGDTEIVFSASDERSVYRAYVLSNLYKQLDAKVNPEGFCQFIFKGRTVNYFFDPEDFDTIGNLNVTFIDEQYCSLDVRDKVVADVGASYGDTAIYFALKGAKKIYAYEPIPWVAKVLEKNIILNNLSEIVKVIPNAVTISEGEAILNVPKASTDASLYGHDNKDTVQISVKTVTPPLDAQVLKLNCEGCEYGIILDWLKEKNYEGMIVNYHNGYEQLERKLRNIGYKVKIKSKIRLLIAK